jgi:iron complex outermembrane receptor protein
MKFITGCLLIAFLLGSYTYTFAQNDISGIHGKVYGEKHSPAEAATVILYSAADSSIIKSTICNNKGQYSINFKPGRYLLSISKIGYEQSFTGPYTIIANKNIAVNDITLDPHIPQLKEVSITAQRNYIDVKPGKVVLNVQSSIIADGNSVADILKQAPGVHIDSHGNLSLIGRLGALVTIDGKPTNLTGQDLNDLLQGMAGNAVNQIELISSPSAKYEASGGGIINIISKKGTNAGTNFVVNAGAGYSKYYKANAGFNFNNRMGIVNIFGSYNYLEDKSFHDFTTNRLVSYNGVLSEYDVNYDVILLKKSNTFRVGTDIAVSPNHTIGLLMSGTVDSYDNTKNNLLNITNQGNLDSVISTMSNIDRGMSNISYDINYNGKLDDKGKALSADFVFNNIDRHSSEYINNHFYDANRNKYRPELYLQNLSPSQIHIWAAKLDYVSPLSKTSQLESGIKYSNVQSNNDLIFGPKIAGVYTSSPQFSNTFIYTENINTAYINYNNKVGKVNITTGLRAEQTNSKGHSVAANTMVDKSYLDLFPQAQIDYRVNEKNSFSVSYNRGINRPKYIAVNPFLYYVDLYDYYQGNPDLKPQYTNKIEISHTYNKTLVTTIYGAITTDFYDLVDVTQNDTTKVSVTTAKNFGTYSVLGMKFFAPVVFNAWWNGDFALDASYQRIKAYPENGYLNKGTQDIIFSSRQAFKLSNTFNAEISGNYESPTFYGIGQFKANYGVDAGLSKQVLNKNGTIKLTVKDIFNTHRDRSTINYQNLNAYIYNKDETRVIRLSFTYRFGDVFLKGNRSHDTGNEDEQKRAGGVAGNTSQGNAP